MSASGCGSMSWRDAEADRVLNWRNSLGRRNVQDLGNVKNCMRAFSVEQLYGVH